MLTVMYGTRGGTIIYRLRGVGAGRYVITVLGFV